MKLSTSNIFVNSLKAIITGIVKLFFIVVAWVMRLAGTLLLKVGDSIERIILKRSSL